LASELVIDIHKMTLHKLPKYEMFEEGSQIRKSIKSVKSTIKTSSIQNQVSLLYNTCPVCAGTFEKTDLCYVDELLRMYKSCRLHGPLNVMFSCLNPIMTSQAYEI